jgi:hypothetical protein
MSGVAFLGAFLGMLTYDLLKGLFMWAKRDDGEQSDQEGVSE